MSFINPALELFRQHYFIPRILKAVQIHVCKSKRSKLKKTFQSGGWSRQDGGLCSPTSEAV